jgi:hypothetical protein
MHRLITLDCSTCRLKTEEPESGFDSAFYESMILLDEVVEVFALPELRGYGNRAFLLQLFDGGWVSVAPIDIDGP